MADLKEKMMLYGVTMGKRCSKEEKHLFLEETEKSFREKGIPCRTVQKQSSVLTVEHMYINDPKKAEIIVAAPYDTPQASYLRRMKWYPFNKKKNAAQDKMNLCIETIVIIGIMLLAVGCIWLARNYGGAVRVLGVILAVMLGTAAWRISRGSSNPVNFSMNSAGLAVLLALAEDMGKSENIAFACMDESAMSLEGAKLMKEDVNPGARMIFLNGLCGSKHMYVHTDDVKKPEELKSFTDKKIKEGTAKQSLNGLYPNSAMLICGEQEDKDLVLPNGRSKRDTEVDMAFLEETYAEVRKMLERK